MRGKMLGVRRGFREVRRRRVNGAVFYRVNDSARRRVENDEATGTPEVKIPFPTKDAFALNRRDFRTRRAASRTARSADELKPRNSLPRKEAEARLVRLVPADGAFARENHVEQGFGDASRERESGLRGSRHFFQEKRAACEKSSGFRSVFGFVSQFHTDVFLITFAQGKFMTTQPPVYPMPPAENPSSTPELLSDEEMRSRAAAYAQKIYEQQLEAYRIQRAQVLAEQQARAEYLRQWQAYQQQFYSPQPAVRVDPDTGAQTFVAGQLFFPPLPDVPASPMPPQQPFPPETPVPAPEEMQEGVPAPEPAATVPVADEISEEENLMPPSESGAEPPENPEEEITDVPAEPVAEENISAEETVSAEDTVSVGEPVSVEETVPAQNDAPAADEAAEQEEASAQENSVPAEENSSEETVPAVEEEAGDVPAAEAVVPAAEEPSGAPDDNDAEPAVEAASETKGKTPPPVGPMPKKIPVFSLFLFVVCAAALAAGAYILFSNDPRFEQPRKNFFSLIGREPRAEAEETENEVSVPAEGESGAENYDEADYFMN